MRRGCCMLVLCSNAAVPWREGAWLRDIASQSQMHLWAWRREEGKFVTLCKKCVGEVGGLKASLLLPPSFPNQAQPQSLAVTHPSSIDHSKITRLPPCLLCSAFSSRLPSAPPACLPRVLPSPSFFFFQREHIYIIYREERLRGDSGSE